MAANVEDLFAEALARSNPQDRAAFLNQACADPDLRNQVESLLHAYQAGEYLEAGVVGQSDYAATAPYDLAAEADEIAFGPYTLLERVGEGGMGVVYVAEQTAPVRRRVALKLIKPGMYSNEVIAR